MSNHFPSSNLITPGHKISNENNDSKSFTHKSQRSRKSHHTSSSHKSALTSSIFSSSTGKPRTFSSANDEVFPDYAVNWGSKNKQGWIKKEMNFNRYGSPKPKTNPSSIESAIIDNNSENEEKEQNSNKEISEENSKEIIIYSGHLVDITEKDEETYEVLKTETGKTEKEAKNVLVRRFFRKVVQRMIFLHYFIRKLRGLVQTRLFPDEKPVDFGILNDLTLQGADFSTGDTFTTSFLQPLDFHHIFLLCWRIFDFLFVFFCMFKLPYETCFGESILAEEKKFGVFSIIFAVLSCLLNFNTMFLSKGKIKNSHSLIFWRYIKSFFIVDILGLVALVIHFSDPSNFISFLYFVKAFSFRKLFDYLIDYSSDFARYSAVNSTIVWMLYFSTISHFLGCVFFLILNNFSGFKESFIIKSDISKFQQYLYTFYFISSQINLFGRFLEKTILNEFELIWIINLNLFSLGFLIYFYHQIFKNTYLDSLSNFNKFMKNKGVSLNLQRKINNYLNYVSKKEQINQEKEKILDKLGVDLRKELLMESYLPILRSIPFFSHNFSERTLLNLSSIVQERSLKPGELVYGDEYMCNHFIYLLNGDLEIFFNKHYQYSSKSSIKRLSQGDSFGEFAFFGSNIEKLNMRSLDESHLITISSEDFITEIKKEPHDYEFYCRLKDSIFLYNDYSNLYKSCYFCQESTHLLSNCPLIHYTPTVSRIVNTSKHNDNVFNKNYTRKFKMKRFHPLKNFKIINNRAIKIQSKFSIDQPNLTNKKSSSSTRGPKESFFYNEENTSSNSSYTFTQKKRLADSPLLPPGSDNFSNNIFNRINEERNMYRQAYTSKSINLDYMANDNSTDLKLLDLNKMKKVTDSFSFSFDKSTFTSFENVKMWSVYFPKNNVQNVVQDFGKKKKKMSILNFARKEEILNKSQISSKRNSNLKEKLIHKIKKKGFRKSKTESDSNLKNRRKSFFDTIKTFFKA